MRFVSTYRFAPISPRKARYVIDLIRGKGISEALNTLRFVRKRAAPMIYKVVRAAMAAAEENPEVDVESLRIHTARVDGGPMRKGRLPRPRGIATLLRHRTCHIRVELATPDEFEPQQKNPSKAVLRKDSKSVSAQASTAPATQAEPAKPATTE